MPHPVISSYELSRRGNEFYAKHLRELVETRQNTSKLVSIDIETGDYEIGDPASLDAPRRLHARHPGAALCTIYIDYDRPAGTYVAEDYGYFPPVEDLLGAATVQVLTAPERAESYIIEDGPDRRRVGFAACKVLAAGPLLNAKQVTYLQESILIPEAHYNGCPRYRRALPVPNFAFRIRHADHILDILIDLHNPGWEFHCGRERYRNWNRVGGEMMRLAKELFPHFASSSTRSLWKKGAIKVLKTNWQAPKA